MVMTPKERVLAAVNLEEADRVPYQLQLAPALWEKLAKYYGTSVEQLQLREEVLGDVLPPVAMTELSRMLSPKDRVRKRLPDGRWIDDWGCVRNPRYMGGGTIDWFEEFPIKDPEDLETHVFPDPYVPGLADALEEVIRTYGDRYVISVGPGWGIFENAWTLYGMEKFLRDLYLQPKFMEKLLDKVLEHHMAVAKQIVKKDIDMFGMGDDYGSQKGLLMNPSLWRRFVKPRLKKLFDIPRSKGLPIFLHSDGDVSAIIPDLIEVGVTILNPVQPLAVDPAWVKQRFGDKLCLWGTICIQRTMPYGSPKDVEDEVKLRVRTCGYDGGLVLAPSHTVTEDTPVENVVAFIRAAKKHGKYPAKDI